MQHRIGRRNRDIVPRAEVDAEQKRDWASRPTPLPNLAREAMPPPGFGKNFLIDDAGLLKLDQAMASAFDQHALRMKDGIEPLRITNAGRAASAMHHGIPLSLTEDNFLTTRRLRHSSHYSPTPLTHAPLPVPTYVDPFMNTIEPNFPAAPAEAEGVYRSPLLLSIQSGVPYTQCAEPFLDDDDDEVAVFELPANEWNTRLALPPGLGSHPWNRYPHFIEHFNWGSLENRQLVHYTDGEHAALINCAMSRWHGVPMHAILPFFPMKNGLKVPTTNTPFACIWTAKNTIEGNYVCMNHVIDKFPEAKTYVRFVISTAKSFDILNDPNTRFWSGSRRGNIFLKYPHPIETNHLQQTVIYRRQRGPRVGTYFSMEAPDAPAACEQ
jgi:hypothetical protein